MNVQQRILDTEEKHVLKPNAIHLQYNRNKLQFIPIIFKYISIFLWKFIYDIFNCVIDYKNLTKFAEVNLFYEVIINWTYRTSMAT